MKTFSKKNVDKNKTVNLVSMDHHQAFVNSLDNLSEIFKDNKQTKEDIDFDLEQIYKRVKQSKKGSTYVIEQKQQKQTAKKVDN